jgi:hypothetical protein
MLKRKTVCLDIFPRKRVNESNITFLIRGVVNGQRKFEKSPNGNNFEKVV